MPPIEPSRGAIDTDVHELTFSDERYPDRMRELSDRRRRSMCEGGVRASVA